MSFWADSKSTSSAAMLCGPSAKENGRNRTMTLLSRGSGPPQNRLLGGSDFIGSADFQFMRGIVQEFRIFTRDLAHGPGKGVERLLALRLRRLDHDGFGHDQRKINCRSVVTKIEKSLGDIHGANFFVTPKRPGAGHEFVHAAIAVRHFKNILKQGQQIVTVEHGVFADLAEPA